MSKSSSPPAPALASAAPAAPAEPRRTLILVAAALFLCACPAKKGPPPADAPAGKGAASAPASAPAPTAVPGDPSIPPPGGFVIGTGAAGFSDDPPQFEKPIRLAAYGPGQVVVADIGNHAVRLVHKDGTVKTLVGGPDKAGHLDGPATRAKLNSPHGVAVRQKDKAIFVGEASGHSLRVLEKGADGTYMVRTLAGVPGQTGFQDGPAASAKFAAPHGIVLDKDGALLVADIGNGRLRRIHDGTVSTVAGTGTPGKADGPAGAGTLHMPMDLARGRDGTVYIADAGAKAIRAFSGKTGLSTPALRGTFAMPHGVAVDEAGRVIIADLYNHTVLSASADQDPVVILGTGTPGRGGNALNRPAAVLVHDGLLWIADLDNHQVKAVPWPPAP